MHEENDGHVSLIEQHIGTILQIMVVALLGWSLSNIVDMRTDVGILKANVTALQNTINASNGNDYKATDAQRDFKAVWDRIDHMDKRCSQLEIKR